MSAAAPTPSGPLRGTEGERPACNSSTASTLAWTALGAATGAFAGWAAHGRGTETGPGLYIGVGAALGGGLGFAADRLCHDKPARTDVRPATPPAGAPAAVTGTSLK